MTTKQLATISSLNRQLAPTFRAAAPESMNWAQEKTFFEAQIRKHWQIAQAVEREVPETIESLKLAVRECASMGLSMSPVSQLVYLIPRRARKKWDNESEADYQRNVPWLVNTHPSYRGLSFIATHYAGASVVAAEVVFAGDAFRYFGPIRPPEHEPTLDNSQRSETKAIGAYAVAVMANGIVRAEYVDQPTIAKVRALSDFPSSLMWTKLWTEGWRKVPIRRICKTLMVSEPRMAAAIETLDRHEGITFEQGPPDNVPRGTSGKPALENIPSPPNPAKGMTGLQNKLSAAKVRQGLAQEPLELDPLEEAPRPPREEREPVTIDQEPPGLFPTGDEYIPEPATSKNPPGSIEWWADQIRAAQDLDRLDLIKVQALTHKVDKSSDADPFREAWSNRFRELRTTTGGSR